jgi:hypothetical protein
MQKMLCLWVVVSLSVLFLFGVFVTNHGAAGAAEAQLVKIQPAGEGVLAGLYIDPPVLYIDKNTIVIWMNGVPQREVQVVFQEGKACKDVTINPMGFGLDAVNCYVTSFIPYGDTSSLQFPEPGTFKYVVQTEGAKLRAKGVIEVRR